MYETQSESSKSSVPNLERCNLGDNFGYRNKDKRLSLPCPCAGCLFRGFLKCMTIIILIPKTHYYLVDQVKNTLT